MKTLIVGRDWEAMGELAEQVAPYVGDQICKALEVDGNTREETLNAGLDMVGRDSDTLIIGDDIVLTEGWYAALIMHQRGWGLVKEPASIIGWTTLDPMGQVADNGFDLVDRDGEVVLVPHLHGEQPEACVPFRVCHAVCGCMMFLRREVLEVVTRFDERLGANRWGEALYCLAAQAEGFRVGVLGSAVWHAGVSTKGRTDISAITERPLWAECAAKYVKPEWVVRTSRTTVSLRLREVLQSDIRRIIIVGAGTVAERLLEYASERLDVEVVSTLEQEVGRLFSERLVLNVETAHWSEPHIALLTMRVRQEDAARLLPEGATIWYVREHDGVIDYEEREAPVAVAPVVAVDDEEGPDAPSSED